jgi:hypothetical protein
VVTIDITQIPPARSVACQLTEQHRFRRINRQNVAKRPIGNGWPTVGFLQNEMAFQVEGWRPGDRGWQVCRQLLRLSPELNAGHPLAQHASMRSVQKAWRKTLTTFALSIWEQTREV